MLSSISLTGYPTTTISDQGHNLQVTILNGDGTVDTNYTGTVHFDSSDPAATAGSGLPRSYVFTDGSGGDDGTHTFQDVILFTAGTQSITATDVVNTGITGTVNGIVVTPGPASSVSVSGYPTPTASDSSHSFTVTIHDAVGNVATGYTGTIHFTSSDSRATAGNGLPQNYTFTTGAGADDGVHTFNATLQTVGLQSITATDTVTGTVTGSEQNINVTAASAFSLQISGLTSPLTAGVGQSFTVTALDQNNQVVTDFTGTIHFTSTDGQVGAGSGLPSDYTFTTGTGKDNGVHTFTAVMLKTAGSQTITATDTANATVNASSPVTVIPAAASQLSVTTQPPNPVTAGLPFTLVVSAKDPFGNLASSYTGSVQVTLANDPGLASTAKAVGGVAPFSLLADTSGQGNSIVAAAIGLSSTTSNPLNIQSQVVQQPAPTIQTAQLYFTPKLKKGKVVGQVFAGFTFNFSTTLGTVTAADFLVQKAIIKRVHGKPKNVPQSVGFSVSAVNNVVTLRIPGKQPFVKGGQITVQGVTSAANVPMSASAQFVILPNAKGIAPGHVF